MRKSLLDRLRCPVDLGPLALGASTVCQDGHIMIGQLHCIACGAIHPVENGVPNMIPATSPVVNDVNLEQLQAHTIDRFGFEWRHFRDWGWLTEYPDVPEAEERFFGGLIEHTSSAFWSKTLFHQDDLYPGLLALDAGCGNGRFTNQAAQMGAEVVGVELGWGAHSAFDHTLALPKVHIVRGDLLRLPFARETFDCVFSIGVLQHPGNAGAAFDSLVQTLRPGALIVAHVYGRGWFAFEILDALIRSVTTRLSTSRQMRFARTTAAAARWLRGGEWRRKVAYRLVFKFVNLLPTEHHMFDWWTAPIATHHTMAEVRHWYSRNDLDIVRTNPPVGDRATEARRYFGHQAITVLGKRPQAMRGGR